MLFQLKNKKRKTEDRTCPVCARVIIEDLQLHVESCLRKQDGESSSDDGDIDVGESYSWCGETRIRATTLIEGSLSSSGIGTTLTKVSDEDEMEVNIDGDDETQVYGTAQFSERDIILLNKDDQRLRDLVMMGGEAPSTSTAIKRETREENNQNVANNAVTSASEKPDSTDSEKSFASFIESPLTDYSNQHQIIESLKAKIREYESFNKPKCLICLDDFKSPVVSICCWHVHCEKCWLQSLGARKLCPQCNMITSASDLRRIYL